MLKNRLLYLVALGAAVLFYAYYTVWFSGFVLLLTLLLPLFSLLCSLPMVLKLRLHLELPEKSPLGEAVRCSVRLHCNGGSMPICRVKLLQTDLLGGEKSNIDAVIWGKAPWVFYIHGEHCGHYTVSPQKVRAYDLLGLFSFPAAMPEPVSVFVMPEARSPNPVPDLNIFDGISYKDKTGGGFSEVYELRQYHPGDMLRDVHWKLSAKRGEIITRQAREPESMRLIISLDRPKGRSELDLVLGRLVWMSEFLLERGLRHSLFWYDGGIVSSEVSDTQELENILKMLLTTPLGEKVPSLLNSVLPYADWRYHISAGRENGL